MFNQYPYLNLNDLNLDYILNEIKNMYNEVTNFVSINAIKYADPIQWDITKQYEKNTIVIDPLTGTAYISVAPVPSGVNINRTDYWTVVFDLSMFITKAAKNLAATYDPSTTNQATVEVNVGQWLVWNDTLYRALVHIYAGMYYVEGTTVEQFTIESVIGHLTDLSTTDKTNLVAAINEIFTLLYTTTGQLQDLSTTDKTNLVAAIDEVFNKAMIGLNSGKNFATAYDPTETDIATISVNATQWIVWKNILYKAITAINIGDRYQPNVNITEISMEEIIGHLNDLDTTDTSNIVAAIKEVNHKTNNNYTLITNLQNDVNDININIASTRKVICIGDSYLGGSGTAYAESESWGAMLRMILNNGSNTIIKGYGGSGFIGQVPDHTYIIQLQEVAAVLNDTEKSEITDIIVQGGLNDKYGFNLGTQTEVDLQTAIAAFTSYAHTTFPNATVRIGVIGWATDGLSDKNNWNKILNCYKNYFNPQCPKLQYMSGVEYIMPTLPDSDYSDAVHPTAATSYRIAEGIVNCIMGGDGNMGLNYTDLPISLTWDSDITEVSNDLKLTIYSSDATISSTNLWFTYGTAKQYTFGDFIKIADIVNTAPIRASLGFDMPCSVWLIDSNNTEQTISGILRVKSKQLYLMLNIPANPISVNQLRVLLGNHSSSVFNIC